MFLTGKRRRAADRRGSRDLTVAVVVAVLAIGWLCVDGDSARAGVEPVATIALMLQLAVCSGRLGWQAALPPATVRFWRTTTVGMGFNVAGVTVDGFADLAGSAWQPGSSVLMPLGSAVTLLALYRYPTTAGTRAERVTLTLDVSVVMLGSAAFLWYFVVGAAWHPSDGLLALSAALVMPGASLVAAFAFLRIAFAGAGVVGRRPLGFIIASIVFAAVAGTAIQPPASDTGLTVGAVFNVLSVLAGVAGLSLQYRSSTRSLRPAGRLRRRAFTALPYATSLGAVVLLGTVLAPVLDARKWGVVAGVGAVVIAVSVRQFVALRENTKLLARNRELAERLQEQAWTDELTGLANRARFGADLRAAVEGPGPAGVLLIDLDDFKTVNDTWGHAAGDRLLVEVAARLRAAVREEDMVYRLGGDEFVVLAERVDEAVLTGVAQRLVEAVARPVELPEGPARVGASVGVAVSRDGVPDAAELLRHADVAMYEVKNAGRNGWRIADLVSA